MNGSTLIRTGVVLALIAVGVGAVRAGVLAVEPDGIRAAVIGGFVPLAFMLTGIAIMYGLLTFRQMERDPGWGSTDSSNDMLKGESDYWSDSGVTAAFGLFLWYALTPAHEVPSPLRLLGVGLGFLAVGSLAGWLLAWRWNGTLRDRMRRILAIVFPIVTFVWVALVAQVIWDAVTGITRSSSVVLIIGAVCVLIIGAVMSVVALRDVGRFIRNGHALRG